MSAPTDPAPGTTPAPRTTPALPRPDAVFRSEIVGVGHYQPSRVVTNDEIATMVDTSDAWIQQRTGIVTRHLASDDETAADLAVSAARHALSDSFLDARAVDMIIVATCTAADRSPNVAGRVSVAIGATSPVIMDVNVACSGFAHALAVADQAVRAGSVKTAIVIGTEKLSAFTDWTDRSTCILTADGAGAFVITASEHPGVGAVTWGSDPDLAGAVRIEAPGNTFVQEGKAVFKWAISQASMLARRTVESSGYAVEDLVGLVSHQANLRIIEPLARQIGVPDLIVATDVTESGNTSAASIPLAFSKLWHAGGLPADSPVLLFGFGGGFAYAGQVVRTPRRRL